MQGKKYLSSKKNNFKYFPIRDEIKDLLKYNKFIVPTYVQTEALGLLLEEGIIDLCVIIYSFNGSGKTLSFLTPVLNSVNPSIPYQTWRFNAALGPGGKETKVEQPQALIIVPNEALLYQTFTYLEQYAKYLNDNFGWNLKIGKIHGSELVMGHIVVGMAMKAVQHYTKFKYFMSELKWVVFDECDEIKSSSEAEFVELLAGLSKNSNANFIVCSATGNEVQEQDITSSSSENFRRFVQQYLPSRNVVELDIISTLRKQDQSLGLTGVTHYYSRENYNKDEVIKDILGQFAQRAVKNQIIIFFNRKVDLTTFYEELKNETTRFSVNAGSAARNNLKVGYIHSGCGCKPVKHVCNEDCDFTKSERVGKLRNKDYNVMLATDLIGRGIDIRTVTLVINYQEPIDKDKRVSDVNYIHRAGRTGRHSDVGVALTFVKDNQLIDLVQNNQKVVFREMKDIKNLIEEAEQCYANNEALDAN